MKISSIMKILSLTAAFALILTESAQRNSDSRSIEWYIKDPPIIFGEDIILVCNATRAENCCSNTATWMRDYDVIIHHGVSANISKYEQKHLEDGFFLTIKSFNESDLNHQYTCLYDFYAFSRIIEMNNTNFQLIPPSKAIQAKIKLKAEKAFATVIFKKVFPLPICNMMFNGSTISSYMNMTHEHNGLFYSATINLICEMNSTYCDGDISVNCLIGLNNIPIDAKIRHGCNFTENKDMSRSANHLLKWLIGSVCTIIAGCIFGLTLFTVTRRKRLMSCIRNLEDGIEYNRDHCTVSVYHDRIRIPEIMPLLSLPTGKRSWSVSIDLIPAQNGKDVLNMIVFYISHNKNYHIVCMINIRIHQHRYQIKKHDIQDCEWLAVVPWTISLYHEVSGLTATIQTTFLRYGWWKNKKAKEIPIILDEHHCHIQQTNIRINNARLVKDELYLKTNQSEQKYNRGI